jgi:hypothetical protein
MADVSKIIDGKKFMWDRETYGSEKEAQDVKQKYENDKFEVRLLQEADQYLLYTRRVVTEIVIEGEPT